MQPLTQDLDFIAGGFMPVGNAGTDLPPPSTNPALPPPTRRTNG
jgi:hypothetical protein